MGGYKVAIIGAGRLGSLLAHRIPGSYRKVIISRERAEAGHLADEVGGIAADQPSAVRGCQLVFLTATDGTAVQWVREVQPHLGEGTLVVNMVPDLATADLADEFASVHFAAAKLIGHPRELNLGTPGVVVLDLVDGETAERLTAMLSGLGTVSRGDEQMVAAVQHAIADTMAEVRSRLTDRLQKAGLSPALAESAIASVAPGVLWSV
ncbi:MAG TPA: NAD(P)-binding domain-containing protein [Symbiobacteriaceae bacterium]|nr:NAD(P)-binding domain-containing protein [Symbiobacteriaceae bacterium]